MNPSEKYIKKLGLQGSDINETVANDQTKEKENGRRSFLKRSALGGVALGAATMFSPIDLKITDMRYCVTPVLGRTAIIRIDTNQGIYGLGEVRDGADERYALFLKSRILGENPCNVELIFKKIRQFGGQARQAGGVC